MINVINVLPVIFLNLHGLQRNVPNLFFHSASVKNIQNSWNGEILWLVILWETMLALKQLRA